MQCKKCGAENTDWGERCIECGAYLKPVKFDGFTKVCLILSIAEAVYLAIVQSMQFIKYILVSRLVGKVIWILIIAVLIAIAVNSVCFMVKKKKRNLKAVCILWGVFFICSFDFRISPILLVIIILPVLFGILGILPQWKKLE